MGGLGETGWEREMGGERERRAGRERGGRASRAVWSGSTDRRSPQDSGQSPSERKQMSRMATLLKALPGVTGR